MTLFYSRPSRRGRTIRTAALPRNYWAFDAELAGQDQPRLRPGAAIAFAIGAVVLLLAFVEIMAS